MRKRSPSDSPFSFSSSSSSSSSLYPSSRSSSFSPSLSSASHRRSAFQPRDHLESLITKHGYPTPVSLSSLRDLTATSSTYTPPSPPRRPRCPDTIPIDPFDSLTLSSSTRPIPIPRRSGPIYEDLPVTPLTGRFDHDSYFDDWERASQSAKSRQIPPIRPSRRGQYPSRPLPSSRMRSDNSPYYSPAASPIMSPRRSNSPQPTRSRTQNPSKAKQTQNFHLGSLPRFHPAVYQPSSTSHNATSQPPSPRQSRQSTYRTTAGSRDMVWQYREFIDGVHQGPSAPRLDPLVSPGPVTPLALEAGDYLAHGSMNNTSERTPRDVPKNSGPPAELVEKLIAYEEKARQMARKPAKGR
ncbi:unnamed protein product [Penicillium nalgiovense]|uniref:Uncharacterized protein n=1 Tax=Penicillium nalgiovense TaxID=60175 RepID=A0A9W4MQK5_PENNA|nr:unnamed protein product [Penicillium nalgiovense]CAG7959942.1 unnamed protein product [Penicillium nalgiovense]CAG7974580.1 unnamed protein product [Penicillium nalgiovense]CAG8009509.1 unnamed protein product [Penicillium nalgiovense]CAG8009981.1 unnamed protein product [Penicillium nalgiovense]